MVQLPLPDSPGCAGPLGYLMVDKEGEHEPHPRAAGSFLEGRRLEGGFLSSAPQMRNPWSLEDPLPTASWDFRIQSETHRRGSRSLPSPRQLPPRSTLRHHCGAPAVGQTKTEKGETSSL